MTLAIYASNSSTHPTSLRQHEADGSLYRKPCRVASGYETMVSAKILLLSKETNRGLKQTSSSTRTVNKIFGRPFSLKLNLQTHIVCKHFFFFIFSIWILNRFKQYRSCFFLFKSCRYVRLSALDLAQVLHKPAVVY